MKPTFCIIRQFPFGIFQRRSRFIQIFGVILIFGVCTLIFSSHIAVIMADTIYVDLCASEPGDGSQSKPYSSVAIAVAAAKPGDTIVIIDGAYNEKVVIDKRLRITSSGRPALIGRGDSGIFLKIDATVVSEFEMDLNAGEEVVFKTTSLSPGSDPVLHLFDMTSLQEVALNDNIGNVEGARLKYTPNKTGRYRLIVRARTEGTAGKCDILMNELKWKSNVAFAGRQVLWNCIQEGEEIQAVSLPNGATKHSLYILKKDGLGIEVRKRGELKTEYRVEEDLGSRIVLVGVPQNTQPGIIRLIRNDAMISGRDPDKDGLGTKLENVIGTCSSLNGSVKGSDGVIFDCRRAVDARDTDGDGISDGWEVLGRDYVDETIREYVPLPLWGADPRHKDIFLEVDFRRLEKGEADRTLSKVLARQFSMYYGDQIETFDPLVQRFRAISLGNPDQKPGISMHIDSGLDPSPTQLHDATLFGDWGGHNVVAPVPDPDAPPKGVKGADPALVWKDNMKKSRRGIFHYALAYTGSVGQNPHFTVYSKLPMDGGASLMAHEFAHTLGLGHSGQAFGGSADPNCKPTYPSIVNYGYLDFYEVTDPGAVGFSHGGRPAINNIALAERNAVNPADTRYLDHLEKVFQYNVDRTKGHVDWNRDGVFSTGMVQAYANYAPGGGNGCEWTRYNKLEVDGASTILSPALARLGDRTYLFFTDPQNGNLHYTYSTSKFDCPQPAEECDGASFKPVTKTTFDAAMGVDAVRIRVNDEEQILVVFVGSNGRIKERRLTLKTGQESWSQPLFLDGRPSAGEPSLASVGLFSAYLAFKDIDGQIRTRRVHMKKWEDVVLAKTLDGVLPGENPKKLPKIVDTASPAIAFTYLPWRNFSTVRQLYGAFAGPSGFVDIWRFDVETGLWEKTDVLKNNPGPILSKPAMAWVPSNFPNERPGRFYLVYVKTSMQIRMMFSYTEGAGASKVETVGLDAFFDNSSAQAQGVALLFEPGVDTNLRAALARGSQNPIHFRPKADGINDYDLADVNDWEVFSVTTCRTLIYPEGGDNPDHLLKDPIRCREIFWLR